MAVYLPQPSIVSFRRYRFLLPEFQETYGAFNPKRCKLAEYPLCACDNAAPAPPGTFAPPPPLAFTEDYHMTPPLRAGEPTLGGAELPKSSEHGSVSAMVKRLVNARTISLSVTRTTPTPAHAHTHARNSLHSYDLATTRWAARAATTARRLARGTARPSGWAGCARSR
jgi:hypothetical protein